MKLNKKIDFKKYIGIPYKHIGRDWNGIDCWGLGILIWKTELGIDLPDYTEVLGSPYDNDWYKKGMNHLLDNRGTIKGTHWKIVQPPFQVLDGLLFYLTSNSIANHGAFYIGNSKMIHVYENSDVHISRIDDKYWSSKLYAALRYEG